MHISLDAGMYVCTYIIFMLEYNNSSQSRELRQGSVFPHQGVSFRVPSGIWEDIGWLTEYLPLNYIRVTLRNVPNFGPKMYCGSLPYLILRSRYE